MYEVLDQYQNFKDMQQGNNSLDLAYSDSLHDPTSLLFDTISSAEDPDKCAQAFNETLKMWAENLDKLQWNLLLKKTSYLNLQVKISSNFCTV